MAWQLRHVPSLRVNIGRKTVVFHCYAGNALSRKTGHPEIRKAKRFFGSIGGAVIRMGHIVDGHLNLAEGFEDAVSAHIINALPNCWGVCGIERYTLMTIPPEVRHITISSQHGAGAENAIERARPRLTANDRTLAVVLPRPGGDWNDALLDPAGAL